MADKYLGIVGLDYALRMLADWVPTGRSSDVHVVIGNTVEISTTTADRKTELARFCPRGEGALVEMMARLPRAPLNVLIFTCEPPRDAAAFERLAVGHRELGSAFTVRKIRFKKGFSAWAGPALLTWMSSFDADPFFRLYGK